MIQRIMQRRQRPLEIAVIDEISLHRIKRSFDDDFHFERVTVHASALVSIRKTRQEVRCFKGETLGKSYMHGERIVKETGRLSAASIGC